MCWPRFSKAEQAGHQSTECPRQFGSASVKNGNVSGGTGAILIAAANAIIAVLKRRL